LKRCRHSAPQASPRPKLATLNLDDRVSWAQQLEHNVAPVVLMSTFLAAPEDVDSFLDGFKKQFAIMRRQPGLISAQLHRGIAGSCLFMNYIVWESVDHFKRGFDLPEFQVQLKELPRVLARCPHYNQDLELALPLTVTDSKAEVAAAHGVVLVSPEFNHRIRIT
jgi:heme-degrading monooxygenase HmoA